MDLYSVVFGAVGHYGSVREASKHIGISKTTINDYLQGRVRNLSNKSEIKVRQSYEKLSTKDRSALREAKTFLEYANLRQKSELLKARNPKKRKEAFDKYVKSIQESRRRYNAGQMDDRDFNKARAWGNYRLINEL